MTAEAYGIRITHPAHGAAVEVWSEVRGTYESVPPAGLVRLLMADLDAGTYVLAFGILLSFAVALANAWVLLVEVLR